MGDQTLPIDTPEAMCSLPHQTQHRHPAAVPHCTCVCACGCTCVCACRCVQDGEIHSNVNNKQHHCTSASVVAAHVNDIERSSWFHPCVVSTVDRPRTWGKKSQGTAGLQAQHSVAAVIVCVNTMTCQRADATAEHIVFQTCLHNPRQHPHSHIMLIAGFVK